MENEKELIKTIVERNKVVGNQLKTYRQLLKKEQ